MRDSRLERSMRSVPPSAPETPTRSPEPTSAQMRVRIAAEQFSGFVDGQVAEVLSGS
jgi:hypothetical protein